MALEHPWTQPPARGTALTVAPGVKWLRMPLPFQLDHINLWLLEDGEGWAIVDTGVGLDDVRALWEQIFAAELGGRPVTRVVLTHFHPDHVGNAGWLTERWGVEFWCTQAEFLIAHVAVQSTGPRHAEARARHYRRNGCDDGRDLRHRLRQAGPSDGRRRLGHVRTVRPHRGEPTRPEAP